MKFFLCFNQKRPQNPNIVSIWICTAKLQLETFKTIKKTSKNIHDMKESLHCYVIDIWVKLYYQLAVMDRWRKPFLKTLNRNFLHLLLSFGYWNTSKSMLRKKSLADTKQNHSKTSPLTARPIFGPWTEKGEH